MFPLPFITFPFKPSQETVPWSASQNEQPLSHDGKGMSTAIVSHDQTKDSPNPIEDRKFCICHNVFISINNHILGYMFIVYIQISIPRYNNICPYTLYIILNFLLFSIVMNSTKQQLSEPSFTFSTTTFHPVPLIFICLTCRLSYIIVKTKLMYPGLTLPERYVGQEALSVSMAQNDKLQVHFIFGESNFIPALKDMER